MSLSNFFRINMPYGMEKNKNGEWRVFNREYMPLGWNKVSHNADFNEPFIYTKYIGLTDAKILGIAESVSVYENSKEIFQFWFYNDKTVPSRTKESKVLWDAYFERLRKISQFKQR